MIASKLQEKAERVGGSPRTGPLYRWLYKHHDAISDYMTRHRSWRVVAEVAAEDGVSIGSTRRELKNLENKWRMVCRAHERARSLTAKREADRAARAEMLERRRTMPSRLPADWTPEFISPAPPEPQPAPPGMALQPVADSNPPPATDAAHRSATAIVPQKDFSVASSTPRHLMSREEKRALAKEEIKAFSTDMHSRFNARHGYRPHEHGNC